MITKKYKTLSREFKELYKASFPENERLSYTFISKILQKKESILIHYYEDSGEFIGFTLSTTIDKFTCLAFFATNPVIRNQGYGKRILEQYLKENTDKIVFLNCEIPNSNDSSDIKYRRYSFYKRNGLTLTPLVMCYKNIDYLTLVNKQAYSLIIDELNEMFISWNCSTRLDTKILSL